VDRSGKVLGRHRGSHGFTVGQRRGIKIGGTPEPLYVLGTDAKANTVTVGSRAELGTQRVALRDLTLHVDAADIDAVKLRYRSAAVGCRLDGDELILDIPFDGAAPGQTAVLLRGGSVAGSATITK
jgi:tRNA-specific 2-thiouridylase